MSSDNGDQSKKRRVGSGVGADGGGDGELLSMMNKLLDQNRSRRAKSIRWE